MPKENPMTKYQSGCAEVLFGSDGFRADESGAGRAHSKTRRRFDPATWVLDIEISLVIGHWSLNIAKPVIGH
jgi:hypothetical protein